MKELKEKYLNYIDERVAEHNSLNEKYKADNRKDEADIEKIKVNIYEIFKALFLSDIRQLEGREIADPDDISIYGGFLLRFDTIPVNWKKSLEKAIEFGDTTKQIIEEHKLEVAKELKDVFLKMLDER